MFKSFEEIVKDLKVVFVGSRVDDHAVNVNNDVLHIVQDFLHQGTATFQMDTF